MKDYLKTQENSVVDLTREKNKLANEVEQLRHDLDRLARNKESEVMGLNDRISKFEEQVEKKKMINDSLNNDYKDL
jgi:archaellum component FlaC